MFFIINLLLCSVSAELKNKTTGLHASVCGPHGFSCPTRELEIEMDLYLQYCYCYCCYGSSNTFTSYSCRVARLVRDNTYNLIYSFGPVAYGNYGLIWAIE